MKDRGTGQRVRAFAVPGGKTARGLLLVAALLATCCVSGAVRPVSGPARRAILMSFDGLGGERLGRLLKAGRLTAGGFSAFAERGVIAGRAVTVTPSLTSVAHISAVTGAPPSRTGIVSNVFHRAGDPLGTTVSGFATEIETETLWEAAARQGKRVGVIVYPGADGSTPRRRGSFGMVWPERPLRHSALLTLPDFKVADGSLFAALEVGTPRGPIGLRLERAERGSGPIRVLAGAEARPVATVGVGEWFRLDAPRPDRAALSGAWCRIVPVDAGSGRLSLYVGAFYGVPAYPDAYRRHLEEAVGPWPGPPDPMFLRGAEAGASHSAYEEQAMRLMEYLTTVLVVTMRRERWDLLIQYQPALDEVEHAFEPSAGEDAGSSGLGEAGGPIERTYQAVDRELARVLKELGPQDALFVHSDHGMASVERALDIERLLESRGWLVRRTPPEMAGVIGSKEVQACVSSGIAHLYVRRDAAGRPDPAEVAALRADIEAFSKENGVLLDQLLHGGERALADLDHPNSGDVVVLLHPGFVFEGSRGGAPALFPPRSAGAHGYRNAYPTLDAAFLALGPIVRPSRPETISLLDVAAHVSRALGMNPPAGTPIQR